MHCTGSDSIKVTTQLKTSENSWEHRKTSKIIWYHPEKKCLHSWGPVRDTLVQFEEDFNSRTEKWSDPVRSEWLSQIRPIPRSPDSDNNHIFLQWSSWTLDKHLSVCLLIGGEGRCSGSGNLQPAGSVGPWSVESFITLKWVKIVTKFLSIVGTAKSGNIQTFYRNILFFILTN